MRVRRSQNSENHTGAKSLTICEHDLLDTTNRQPILDRYKSDCDFIPWFECLLTKTQVDHIGWITGLGHPMDNFALVIFFVELQKAMGVRPKPFDYRCFHRDFFRCVECGGTVVSE